MIAIFITRALWIPAMMLNGPPWLNKVLLLLLLLQSEKKHHSHNVVNRQQTVNMINHVFKL